MARKTWDDDDGRTVADMSDLYVRTPLGYYRIGDRAEKAARRKAERAERAETARQAPPQETTREERSSAIWGALSAALLIALAFIVGLGLIILILYLVFKSKL